eukprot:gene13167-biopygen12491
MVFKDRLDTTTSTSDLGCFLAAVRGAGSERERPCEQGRRNGSVRRFFPTCRCPTARHDEAAIRHPPSCGRQLCVCPPPSLFQTLLAAIPFPVFRIIFCAGTIPLPARPAAVPGSPPAGPTHLPNSTEGGASHSGSFGSGSGTYPARERIPGLQI